MPGRKVIRKMSAVLPPKNHKEFVRPADDPSEGKPVLPPRDPGLEKTQLSIYLPRWIWAALEEISAATVLPPRKGDRKQRREYTRNEVIERFLEDRILAWRAERQNEREPGKK